MLKIILKNSMPCSKKMFKKVLPKAKPTKSSEKFILLEILARIIQNKHNESVVIFEVVLKVIIKE